MNKKNPARINVAILLALVLNPHVIKAAPMRDEPRYPAGRVSQGIPPDIRVAPPSSAEARHVSVLTPRNVSGPTIELY